MQRHEIEWEDKGTHGKHLSVMDYKKEQWARAIAELETVKAEKQGQVEWQEQRLKELAPAVKNMEQLAAQFSDDLERILPEPGPLESDRSYQKKKAKPLLAQIVRVLCSVYRAYLNLKSDFVHMQEQYSRAASRCNSFSAWLDNVLAENKILRRTIADYERVKQAFGSEEIERAVEGVRCREAQEREKKKGKRKFSREER